MQIPLRASRIALVTATWHGAQHAFLACAPSAGRYSLGTRARHLPLTRCVYRAASVAHQCQVVQAAHSQAAAAPLLSGSSATVGDNTVTCTAAAESSVLRAAFHCVMSLFTRRAQQFRYTRNCTGPGFHNIVPERSFASCNRLPMVHTREVHTISAYTVHTRLIGRQPAAPSR